MNKGSSCCEKCLSSKYALKGEMKEKFGGICGLTCDCHWAKASHQEAQVKDSWESVFWHVHGEAILNLFKDLSIYKDLPPSSNIPFEAGMDYYDKLKYFISEEIRKARKEGAMEERQFIEKDMKKTMFHWYGTGNAMVDDYFEQLTSRFGKEEYDEKQR